MEGDFFLIVGDRKFIFFDFVCFLNSVGSDGDWLVISNKFNLYYLWCEIFFLFGVFINNVNFMEWEL